MQDESQAIFCQKPQEIGGFAEKSAPEMKLTGA
jgi:hypothetical protein